MFVAVLDNLQCEVTCVVHIEYYNHLLAVDMAGVACRRLYMSYWQVLLVGYYRAAILEHLQKQRKGSHY